MTDYLSILLLKEYSCIWYEAVIGNQWAARLFCIGLMKLLTCLYCGP